MLSRGLSFFDFVKFVYFVVSRVVLSFFEFIFLRILCLWGVMSRVFCCFFSDFFVEFFENFKLFRFDVDVWSDFGDGFYSFFWILFVYLKFRVGRWVEKERSRYGGVFDLIIGVKGFLEFYFLKNFIWGDLEVMFYIW